MLYPRLSVLLAKTEGTKGTAETPTGSDGAFNVFDMDLTPNIETVDRPQQGSADYLPHSHGPRLGTCTFRLQLHGLGASGAVPAWATTFLPACGWINTAGTFTRSLAVADQKTLTFRLYRNGMYQLLTGAAGTFTITARNGAPSDINFTFTGKYGVEADGSNPTPTFPTVMPPRGMTTATLAAAAVKFSTLTLDAGGVVSPIADPTDTTGIQYAAITDYDSQATFDPEAKLVATRPDFNNFINSTEQQIIATVNGGANNTITLTAPKFQIASLPFGTRDNILTRQLAGRCNNGFTIAFS